MKKHIIHLKREYINALRVGWFLANRQIRRSSWWTTGLIVFIMTLTFLNLVVVSGLLIGLIAGSFTQFRESYSGEVLITTATGRDYIENSPALISFLQNHPRVNAFSARRGVNVQLLGTLNDLPDKNERANRIGIRLTGIDPIQEEVLTRFSRFILHGQMLRGDEEGYILIGANMLRKYSSFADANIPGLDLLDDVDIGSRVRVTIPRKDPNASPITKDLVVKGIVKSKVDEISTRAFIVDRELKRMFLVN
jgi:hypothetical protein